MFGIINSHLKIIGGVQMETDYSILYNVTIEFDKELSENDILGVVSANFYLEDILSRNEHELKVTWEVPDNEGIHEIENELYYILEDGKHGTYTYEKVSSK